MSHYSVLIQPMKTTVFDKSNVIHANSGMIDQLKKIWSVCFKDNPRNIDIFFSERFTFTDCYVYNKNDILVAMLYILPSKLILSGNTYPTGYIYACATLPEHRSGGIMSGLISTAMQMEKEKYDAFALVPAEQSLFDYYARLGFGRFFFRNTLSLSSSGLPKRCYENAAFYDADISTFTSIMNDCMIKYSGSMIWDETHVSNAVKSAEVFGGRALCFDVDGVKCCAVCYLSEHDAEIAELFCPQECVTAAISALFDKLSVEHMTVRLPYIYKNEILCSVSSDRGMIYNVRLPENELNHIGGYLPLAMD